MATTIFHQKDVKLERALIGRRLRLARERAACSLDDAAIAAGVQPLAVKYWEKGRSAPCLVQLRSILSLYGIMAGEVLFEENPYRIPRAAATELLAVASQCSPAVQMRIELLVALMGEART